MDKVWGHARNNTALRRTQPPGLQATVGENQANEAAIDPGILQMGKGVNRVAQPEALPSSIGTTLRTHRV